MTHMRLSPSRPSPMNLLPLPLSASKSPVDIIVWPYRRKLVISTPNPFCILPRSVSRVAQAMESDLACTLRFAGLHLSENAIHLPAGKAYLCSSTLPPAQYWTKRPTVFLAVILWYHGPGRPRWVSPASFAAFYQPIPHPMACTERKTAWCSIRKTQPENEMLCNS